MPMITHSLLNLHVSSLCGSENSTIDAAIVQGRVRSIMPHNTAILQASKYRIDCQGGYATRAFCDSHIHLTGYCLARSQIHLDGLNLDMIHDSLTEIACQRQPGSWIRGRGWEMNLWNNQMHRIPRFLDTIFPENPVALISKDGHSLWMNHRAMAEMGLSLNLPDPPGGRYDRDPQTGYMTGILRETAAENVLRYLPKPNEAEIESLLQDGIKVLIENGITSVHAFENEANIIRLIKHFERSSQRLRCRFYVESQDFDSVQRLIDRETSRSDNYCFGGLKLFADGALGSRTAAMTSPYEYDPLNFGILIMDGHQIAEAGLRAAGKKADVSVHAIGDRALQETLDAFEIIRAHFPELLLRVEHVQLAQKKDIDRIKKLGVIASIQPSHLLSDREMAVELWSHQTGIPYPYGSLERAAIPILFGSDAPIEPPDPLRSLRAAIFRVERPYERVMPIWHPEEAMSINASIQAACATDIRRILSITDKWGEGCRADLVVWDRDPMEFLKFGGARPRAMMVMVGGDVILDRLTPQANDFPLT